MADEGSAARRLHAIDARVGEAIRCGLGRVPGAVTLTRGTTDLGSMFMVVGAATVLVAEGRLRQAVEVGLCGGLGWTVAQRAKGGFDRPRPYESESTTRLIEEPIGSSMPSGHATVIAAVATVLASGSSRGRRWPWLLVAGWVPVTRIHLGVHYPGDTLAGLALGRLLGLGVVAISARPARGRRSSG